MNNCPMSVYKDNECIVLFRIFKFILFSLLFFFGEISAAGPLSIGDQIKNKFDSNLFKLKPINQSHYAIRLYRITGKDEYIYPIVSFQFIESLQLHELLRKQTSSLALSFNANALYLPQNYQSMKKAEKRKILLKKFPKIAYDLKILLILDHAQQLNILKSPLYPHAKTAIDVIKKDLRPLRAFLLNSTVIKISSAQVVNFIYLLNRLELVDLRKQYINRFKIIFSDKKDNRLTDKMFEDKIYGMTHIIFAASDYYQKQIPYEEYEWIYTYFETHIDRILAKTKPDVITEVGLAFCLAKNVKNSPSLSKIKTYLSSKYNADKQIIPGKYGSDDLNLAEHRNVLTIMLFNWPSLLHPGPSLERAETLLRTLETIQPL